MKRLNIFVDETGEFGFNKGSAKLYGVSLVFHEQRNNLNKEILALEEKLGRLGFYDMIHMGDLVMGRKYFNGMDVAHRRKIYTALYKFSRQVDALYHTIIIDKRNAKNNSALSSSIKGQLNNLVINNLKYFQSFDQIKVYYDGGQKPLNKIINEVFATFSTYEQVPDFDHTEKKLFQVADMLTYVDKLIYKYNKGIKLSKTDQIFFSAKYLRTVINELKPHRFQTVP